MAVQILFNGPQVPPSLVEKDVVRNCHLEFRDILKQSQRRRANDIVAGFALAPTVYCCVGFPTVYCWVEDGTFEYYHKGHQHAEEDIGGESLAH